MYRRASVFVERTHVTCSEHVDVHAFAGRSSSEQKTDVAGHEVCDHLRLRSCPRG